MLGKSRYIILVSLLAGSMINLQACSDDSNSNNNVVCTPECTDGCTCDNGTCKDADGNICDDNTDDQPATCDPECADGCICDNGTCVDADGNICDDNTDDQPATCDPECTDGCTCDDGTCKDADGNVCDDNADQPATCDPECTDGCTCDDGTCKDADGNICDNNTDEPATCDPECTGDCTCVEGICKDADGNVCEDKPATCVPECAYGCTCDDGVCKNAAGNACAEPTAPECDPACTGGTVCYNNACVCPDGVTCSGMTCDTECTAPTVCDDKTGKCVCPEGSECPDLACDPACTGTATCVNGVCVCPEDDPNCVIEPQPTCDASCTAPALCLGGQCICPDGLNCDGTPAARVCEPACTDKFVCVNGVCECPAGETCVTVTPGCTGGTVSINGECVCPDNVTCSGMTCDTECISPSICDDTTGKCVCPEGSECPDLACDPTCVGNATCVNGVCVCPEGDTSCTTDIPACDASCTTPAACINGECVCPDDANCDGTPAQRVCAPECEGEYTCVNGECVCPEGVNCDGTIEPPVDPPVVVECDPACTGKYVCLDGSCVCPDGEVCDETPAEPEDDSWMYITGSCLYVDSDGDFISDLIEGRAGKIDSDGDGTPDYLDTDSDNDGVPDSIEGETRGCSGEDPRDRDGDDIPNYLDTDSDNNGISDGIEAGNVNNPVDTDGDNMPDYLDKDNDGDTIPDKFEIYGSVAPGASESSTTFAGDCDKNGKADNRGTADKPVDCDKDGKPDYMDTDTDNDGIPDIEEASIYFNNWYVRYMTDIDNNGIADGTEGVADPDDDKIPNYLDDDNDNDGLKDSLEKEIGSNPNKIDTDGDGYVDASEYAAAKYAVENGVTVNGTKITSISQVINNNKIGVKDIFDFYFELPYEGEKKNDILEFIPKVSKLDVVFNVDTSGSMSGTINNVKTNINNMINTIRSMVTDSGFALVNFDDYPTGGYGYYKSGSTTYNDLPFRVLGKISTNATTVANYTKDSLFKVRYGGDGPESGVESLHYIVTGKGVSWNKYDSNNPAGSLPNATNAPNTWGGVDFRDGTLPVVVHVTDAESHDSNSSPYSKSYVPNPHYSADLLAAVKETGARIIPLGVTYSNSTRRSQGLTWAKGSDAIVPVCAFGLSATQCNLGDYKTSPETINGKEKQCVLNYEGEESAVANMISTGIDALVKYGTYEVSTTIEGVPIPGSTKDTSCFIKQVVATAYVAPPADPEKTCNPVAEPTKVGGSTYNNGFKNFAPGTSSVNKEGARLHFTVYAQNDNCVKPIEEAQTFTAYINVVNPTTGLVFGRRQVSIIVPGEFDLDMSN